MGTLRTAAERYSPHSCPSKPLHHIADRSYYASSRDRTTRAGLPATIARGGTDRVTTLPAPTIASSPMVTPQRIVALVPIEAPRLTTVDSTAQSCSVCK